LYHEKGNRLLLVGDRTAGDVVHKNVVYALNLEDGSVYALPPLSFLKGLSGYSIAVDQLNEKAYLVGGTRWIDHGQAAPPTLETVFEVWTYDLQNRGFRLLATEEQGPTPRNLAALAVDSIRHKLFVYGGAGPEGEPLSDLWELNTVSGTAQLIDDGTAGHTVADDQPVLAYDRWNRRFWLLEGMRPEPDLAAQSLDLQKPGWKEQQIYTLELPPPGHRTGQIRFGRPETVHYTVAADADYGQLFAARLSSEEPHLKVVLRDADGNVLNESCGLDETPAVIWPAIPGEKYQLVISPGRKAMEQENPYFDLEIEEVEGGVVGTYSTGWKVRDMDISQDVAYLACRQGLETVDVSDATAPVLIARHRHPKKARSVAMLGRWLALGRGPGLWSLVILDTTDPQDMNVVGRAGSLGMGRDLAWVGRTIYAAQGLSGVKVYSAKDPAEPQLVGSLAARGPVLSVAATKKVLYAGHMRLGWWSKNGGDLFDISCAATDATASRI
jgi:hypothetical protein